LLNEFHFQKNENVFESTEISSEKKSDEDILDQLNTIIDKTKQDAKDKTFLFNSIQVGTNGSTFIKASPDIDVLKLGTKILENLSECKTRRTKFTNRFIPVEVVCKANISDIYENAGKLFDKYFLKNASTFAINFNRRCNNDLSRDDVIKQLADLVTSKNIGNKVNLKNPDKSINLEVIKGLCLISVLPNYLKLKKYNLNELWSKKGESGEHFSKN
jgi:tRNA acetyltransferase TAN1